MISRPAPDLRERIHQARQAFHLTLAQMAEELRLTPEWLSKILNGHHPPSYNVGLRFEDFLRRHGVDPASFARDGVAAVPQSAKNLGPTKSLQQAIEADYQQIRAAAGDDVSRLTRVAERMRELAKTEHSPAEKIEQKPRKSRVAPKPMVAAAISVPRDSTNRESQKPQREDT